MKFQSLGIGEPLDPTGAQVVQLAGLRHYHYSSGQGLRLETDGSRTHHDGYSETAGDFGHTVFQGCDVCHNHQFTLCREA